MYGLIVRFVYYILKESIVYRVYAENKQVYYMLYKYGRLFGFTWLLLDSDILDIFKILVCF